MGHAHSLWGEYLNILFALFVVILLIWVCRYCLVYFFRSPLRKKSEKDLKIKDSLILDQKRRVILISYQNKSGLLLIGGGNDVFLGWVEDQEEDSSKSLSKSL